MKKMRNFLTISFVLASIFSELTYTKGVGKGGIGGGKSSRKNKGVPTEKEIALQKLIDASQWTPLQEYINGKNPNFGYRNGLFDDVKNLIEDKKININEQGKYGNTALIEALRRVNAAENKLAESGHSDFYKIIDLLLKQGADVNIENFSGDTALFIALVRAPWHVVLQLLGAGADLKHVNREE